MVKKIIDCNTVRDIRKRASASYPNESIIAIYCTEWSDDFDPNVSNKSNRQSCWIKTVTILSCNPDDVVNKFSATFPIAVGKKGN